ncbi:unnamed protein product, partial [Dibothriocephalus latus]
MPPAQPPPPHLQTVPAQAQLPVAPQAASTARICQLFNNINRPAFYPPTTSEKIAVTPSLEFAYDNEGGTMVDNSTVGQPFEYANMLQLSAPLHLQGPKADDRIRDPGDQTITTGDSGGLGQIPLTTQRQEHQQQQVSKLRPQNGFLGIPSQGSSSSFSALTVASSCSTSTSRRRPALDDTHTDRKPDGGPLFATVGQFTKEG